MKRIIYEDVRQSAEYGKYMKCEGWETVWVGRTKIFIKDVLGVGSVAKIMRPYLPLPLVEIDFILRERRVFFARLEPRGGEVNSGELGKHGWRLEKDPLRATKTIIVDLKPTEGEIMAGFRRARARIKNIRIQDTGFRVRYDKFEDFFKVWGLATKMQKIWSSTKRDYDDLVESFGQKCFCVMVDDFCGCLVLMHRKVAYYYYAAALPEAKKRGLAYLAVWEAMKEAKRRGCAWWDWEGVDDMRWPKPGWRGFSQFKRTFGGVEEEMPGSYCKRSWRNIFYRPLPRSRVPAFL